MPIANVLQFSAYEQGANLGLVIGAVHMIAIVDALDNAVMDVHVDEDIWLVGMTGGIRTVHVEAELGRLGQKPVLGLCVSAKCQSRPLGGTYPKLLVALPDLGNVQLCFADGAHHGRCAARAIHGRKLFLDALLECCVLQPNIADRRAYALYALRFDELLRGCMQVLRDDVEVRRC